MKTSCPKCPSSDAYHIYDYGKPTEHGHCFSCGYHKFSDGYEFVKSQVEQLDKDAKEHIQSILSSPTLVALPAGASKTIDVKGLQWLAQYGIIRDEIIANDVHWSPIYDSLVFPIRDKDGELKAYTRRLFSSNAGKKGGPPKWITHGPIAQVMHTIGEDKEKVVLVEDIVSAIKVGRHTKAMPLFSSVLTPLRLMWLHANTDHVVFWLDPNKWDEALRFSKSCDLVGLKTRILYSDKDPKSCSDEEIVNLTSL